MRRYGGFIVFLIAFLVFVLSQARGIVAGDSGDLVTAAYLFGVPHPPGYPLYTFLGWLVSRLPFETVAWRVTLLSSIPHAIVLAVIYALTVRISKSVFAGLFAALVLAGNYLFFLYSVTPEVFALFDLFVVGLTYLAYRFWEQPSVSQLWFGAFVVGASLAHHHVILFFLPAVLWVVYTKARVLLRIPKAWIYLSVWFIVGFSWYLYIPIAASQDSIINWNRATNWAQFMRLVTRADYGTFTSGGAFGALPVQRLLQIKAYAQFLLLDWTIVGLVLSFIGGAWVYRRQHRFGVFFLVVLFFVGPLFFFYASFPLINRFTLGTYERFLLPSYVLLAPLTGIGCMVFMRVFTTGVAHISQFAMRGVFTIFLAGILCVYPLSQMMVTMVKFTGLQDDTTAEALGRDILSSVPKGAVLILYKDTPLFITQYVRYALGERSDVIVLHGNRLVTTEYAQSIRYNFPSLVVPSSEAAAFMEEFIEANRENVPIYANMPIAGKSEWVWVPAGLVYHLSNVQDLPSTDEVFAENTKIWETYSDPTHGILSRFDHLMLSDIRDVYADGRIALGRLLLKAGKTAEARVQFQKAIALRADALLSDAYTYEGIAALFEKRCDEALDAFAKARMVSLAADTSLMLYESVTYRDCLHDSLKAKELFEAYETQERAKETKLQ